MARRERAKPEEDNELRWLTTYGDVVTLLLAFFVMLYAISQVDQQKFQLFVTGLADPFGNPASAQGLLTDGASILAGAYSDPSAGQADGDEGIEGVALLDGMPDINRQTDEASQDGEDAQQADDSRTLDTAEEFQEVREAVVEALSNAGFGEVVDFQVDQRGLTIAIATDDVLFASGSPNIGPRGEDIIAALAPTLTAFDNPILVEGHTDNVPLDTGGYDNWNLSTDRALAVLKLLVDGHGIDPSRMAATGYGEFQPKQSNETNNGKAVNRRVDLVIVADGGDPNG